MGVSFKLCSKSLASRELAREAPPAGRDPIYKILWDWCVWKVGLGTLNHLGTAEGCQVVARVLGCQKSCLVGGQRDTESPWGIRCRLYQVVVTSVMQWLTEHSWEERGETQCITSQRMRKP